METHTEQPVRYNHLGVVTSSLLMDGVATAGFIALAALAFVLWSRNRRFVHDFGTEFNPDAPLVLGKAYITGTVEWEKGASLAVRALIEEEGDETESSGVWTHKWSEKNRKVYVQPFYIRHASGHRIRVEAGKNVRLMDAMDRVVRVNLITRVRVAEVTPGETVFAAGELLRAPDPEASTEGYRGQVLGYLLVPLPDRDMFIGTEPLHLKRKPLVKALRRNTIIIVTTILLFHGLFASFHARRWLGETLDAHVTALDDKYDFDGVRHHRVSMEGTRDFKFVDEVDPSDFGRLREGDSVQVRYVPQWKSASVIGPGATVNALAYSALPLCLIMLALAFGLGSHRLEWYDSKKGHPQFASGRLAASKPFVPEDGSAPAEASVAVQESGAPEDAGSTSEPPSPHRT